MSTIVNQSSAEGAESRNNSIRKQMNDATERPSTEIRLLFNLNEVNLPE